MGLGKALLNIYDKQYKKLMIISLLLLATSLCIVGYNYATTGDVFKKGVSLKGGITLTIPVTEQVNIADIESKISNALPKADIDVRALSEAGTTKAIVIEAADTEQEPLEKAVRDSGVELIQGQYNVESMGGSLGENFFNDTGRAVILAFIAMAIVVFITFRAIVPSLFVMLAAVSDLVTTLAVVDILGIRISTAGIAAFLMLIGYSVDTDILLTTKVLKRKKEGGTVFERTVGAMKTGMIMSLTSFAAALAAFIFSQSDIIKQIMLIVAVGLFFDMIYTWIQNAGILRWWMERKHGDR